MKSSFGPLARRRLGCEIVCETIKLACARLGERCASDVLHMSRLRVREFVSEMPWPRRAEDMFKHAGLGWTLLLQQTDDRSAYKRSLTRLMNASSNMTTIMSIFDPDELDSDEFLAALVEVILEKCCCYNNCSNDNNEDTDENDGRDDVVDLERFESIYGEFLRRLVENDERKQVRMLHAVQSFGYKKRQARSESIFFGKKKKKILFFWKLLLNIFCLQSFSSEYSRSCTNRRWLPKRQSWHGEMASSSGQLTI